MLFWTNEAEKCLYCYHNVHCCYYENTNIVNMIILSTYLSGIKNKLVFVCLELFIKRCWYLRVISVLSLE